MRILLVQPPRRDGLDAGQVLPPLGLAYLAQALRDAGHRVQLLDARARGLSWRGLERRLARAAPDLVGVSAMTPVADLAARALRLARPHARWLALGGAHPSAVGEAVFAEMPELDFCFEGEAEQGFPRALRWLEGGAGELPDGPPPPGLRLPGRPFESCPPPAVEQLPRPAWDLLPSRRYRHLLATRQPMATFISSRGCPHRCSFCDQAVSGSRWRPQSAERTLSELRWLARRHGVRFVAFYDDCFTHDYDRVAAICEGILASGLDLEWKCEARVDSVDLALLRLMRRAGCRLVAFGVESAWAPSLLRLRKGFGREQVVRAFHASRQARLATLAYVILGVPGEGRAHQDAALRFCRHLGASYVQFSTLAALPGSPLATEEHGPLTEVRGFLDGDRVRATLSDLPPEELARELKRAWARFYLRPLPAMRLARAGWRSGAWRDGGRLGRALGTWILRK